MILRSVLLDLVKKCEDEELLDLLVRMLIAEGVE